MSHQERYCIAGSEPYLRGHFPGNPTVPAVIILGLVLETVQSWKEDLTVCAIPHVKFKAPLPPDVTFTIVLREMSDRVVGFECRTVGLVHAEGKARLSVAPRKESI